MTRDIVVERRTPPVAPALAIGGRFKGFQPENEVSCGRADVRETVALRHMKAAWRTYGYDITADYDQRYLAILESVENLRYTAEDMEQFSLALAEFQQEVNFSWKAGLFLSTLINNCEDSHYVIHMHHLVVPPGFIGFRNKKNITVDGDAGIFVGRKMIGGCITVRGDALWSVGREMKSGSITVEGDAENFVGYCMEGGSITIEGNVGERVGAGMSGGEIWLEGGYQSLSDEIRGGRIYHKGKLIYPK